LVRWLRNIYPPLGRAPPAFRNGPQFPGGMFPAKPFRPLPSFSGIFSEGPACCVWFHRAGRFAGGCFRPPDRAARCVRSHLRAGLAVVQSLNIENPKVTRRFCTRRLRVADDRKRGAGYRAPCRSGIDVDHSQLGFSGVDSEVCGHCRSHVAEADETYFAHDRSAAGLRAASTLAGADCRNAPPRARAGQVSCFDIGTPDRPQQDRVRP
jgi:hypothetical protein